MASTSVTSQLQPQKPKKTSRLRPQTKISRFFLNILPRRPRSRAPNGILYYQRAWYTPSQMAHIARKFKNHIDRAPRVVFSDNYCDYQRKGHQKRLDTGPQAKVVAPYDRSFGFAIPTGFKGANACGFINSDHNFNTLIRHLFTKLEAHLRRGGDVIIPSPTDRELTNSKWRNIYYKKGKQVIFHNIGTAMLNMDKRLFIQDKINKLRSIAASCKVITSVNYKLCHAKPAKGCLVFQTALYAKAQMERIDVRYQSDYTSAPRLLFGDNDLDSDRDKIPSSAETTNIV
eukprot:1007190_1